MKISDVKLYHLSVPLKKPFKTSLRTVNSAEETVVIIKTDLGLSGIGEAPPAAVITGEINEGISGIIRRKIGPAIIGRAADNLEGLVHIINDTVVGNSSAKAAVEMAVYDLYGKIHNI